MLSLILPLPYCLFLSLSHTHRADVADQQYAWQDDLFGDNQWRPQSSSGAAIIKEEEAQPIMHAYTLWPGLSKPGLWMSFVSKLAVLARTCSLSNIPPILNQCDFLLDRTVSVF